MTARLPSYPEIDRGIPHPELSNGHFRHPLGQRRMEAQDPGWGIGVYAEERGDEVDNGPGGPRLGDVRPQVLDGEPAGISGESGKKLRRALRGESRGCVENACGHCSRFVVESVGPEAGRRDGVVMRPHRAR